MANHEHGNMDIKTHEETFNGFITWVKRVVIVILAVLIFLAIFAT